MLNPLSKLLMGGERSKLQEEGSRIPRGYALLASKVRSSYFLALYSVAGQGRRYEFFLLLVSGEIFPGAGLKWERWRSQNPSPHV